jgi:hypothetical protein
MNVQSAVRPAASIVALVTLPLVVGCGGDDGTGTNGSDLFGTWSVTSITIDDVEVFAGTGASATMTFRSDGTYTISASGDTDNLFCDGTTSCTENGTYVYTSTTFTICDPGCDEAGFYTIVGNTMTYQLFDPDLGVAFVMTGVRVS